MLKYAELFIDHLQKINPVNVNFKVEIGVDEEGNETLARVRVPYGETNIAATFFGDKNGTHFTANMVLGVVSPNGIKLVLKDLLLLCNKFNNKNPWVKFCLRDGNTVPGLKETIICLEESTILVERTAAQTAYSIVSNLIKAHAEAAEPFKQLLG